MPSRKAYVRTSGGFATVNPVASIQLYDPLPSLKILLILSSSLLDMEAKFS